MRGGLVNGDERREMRDRLFLLRRGWRRTQWGWRHPGLGSRDLDEGAALTLGLAAAERYDRRPEGTSRARGERVTFNARGVR